jgi:hypothetical protein
LDSIQAFHDSWETFVAEGDPEVDSRLTKLESALQAFEEDFRADIESRKKAKAVDPPAIVYHTIIKDFGKVTADAVKQLGEDVTKFFGNSSSVQTVVLKEIADINADFSFVGRLAAAERRLEWCIARISKWRKSQEKAIALEVDEEHLIALLGALEDKVFDIEKQLDPAAEKPPNAPVSSPTMAEPPGEATPGKRVSVSLPEDLPLTYTEEELALDIFPNVPG